jgi:hypothetical protein
MNRKQWGPASLSFRCFLAAFFCLPGVLWGQETGYRIEEDGRFVQLLNWEEQGNALYYEVEIEKQAGEFWEGALTGQTEEARFEFSLDPGVYRYRIRAYDFLERPGPASDWVQFEILSARQPEITRFSPDVFYLDENEAWVITLYGRNFAQGIDVFLEESQGGFIKPETVTVGPPGNEARLAFSYGQLVGGRYAIHVTNPGGLAAAARTFRISFRKPVELAVSAGYRPLVSIYGHINELFGTVFFPAGAYGRLSITPIKKPWGYVGFEIEPSWNYILAAKDGYDVRAQMPGAAIQGLYQKWFSNRAMALNFRIGGGVYSVLDYRLAFDNGSTEPITVLIPVLEGGVSLQWFVKKPFFVEAGLNFSHLFTVDDSSPGYLRPFAGAGWQF